MTGSMPAPQEKVSADGSSSTVTEKQGVLWPVEVAEKFWEACKAVFDLRTAKMLEQRLRLGTGTEHLCEIDSCGCGHSSKHTVEKHSEGLAPYCFKKGQDDQLGELLQKTTYKNVFISSYLGEVAERSATAYRTIMEKQAGEKLSRRNKASLQRFCLRNVLCSLIERIIRSERASSNRMINRDGGLVAYPSSYRQQFPESSFAALNSISQDQMAALMSTRGMTMVHDWVDRGSADRIKSDYEWIEMNNILEDQTPFSPDPWRTDQAVWLTGADLPQDREQLAGLRLFFEKMVSLPFELNAKTGRSLTICNSALFSMLPRGSYVRKHTDNVSGQHGNGRAFTALYFLNPEPNDPHSDSVPDVHTTIRFWIGNNATELQVADNTLVLFQAIDRPYEITPATRKCYLVYYFITGIVSGHQHTKV